MPSREKELINALPKRTVAKIEELRYDVRQDCFWDMVSGHPYTDARSVNGLVPKSGWPVRTEIDPETNKMKEVFIKPAVYLAAAENDLIVNDSIWWPGQPRIVTGYMMRDNGALEESASRNILFNIYTPPPNLKSRKKTKPDKWINHVKELWPIEVEHNFLFDYCAHMLQKPWEKANAVITLSGEQGIGKDMALDPVKASIGLYNAQNITPENFMSQYNPWVQTLMLVIDEMRAFKEDFHASSIYEKLKSISVTPPDTIPVSEKYMKLRYVINVLRVFVTTNEMTAMYIHPNDRRFAIFHSSKKQGWQPQSYFTEFKRWMVSGGGNAAVATWLRRRDISKFDPKRRPIETAGWRAVVGGWSAPDDGVAQALDKLNKPPVFFPSELLDAAPMGEKEDLEKLLKSPRRLTHRMQSSNYFVVPFDPPLEFIGIRRLRYKAAYAKYELLNSKEEMDALIRERGRLLADNVAILAQASSSNNEAETGD